MKRRAWTYHDVIIMRLDPHGPFTAAVPSRHGFLAFCRARSLRGIRRMIRVELAS